jgi:hypothetical protein
MITFIPFAGINFFNYPKVPEIKNLPRNPSHWYEAEIAELPSSKLSKIPIIMQTTLENRIDPTVTVLRPR